MRGWGRPQICKVAITDHGLGIQDKHNLVGKGKKGKHGGQGRI
jgi:hypothetical protein